MPAKQDHEFHQQLERKHVQSDHAVVGGWLLNTWQIPAEVTLQVGMSHASSCSSKNEQDVIAQKCIYLSGHLADCILVDENRQDFQGAADLMKQHMSISMTDFLPLVGHIASHFLEMASLFDIDVGDVNRIQSIKELAALTLLPDDSSE